MRNAAEFRSSGHVNALDVIVDALAYAALYFTSHLQTLTIYHIMTLILAQQVLLNFAHFVLQCKGSIRCHLSDDVMITSAPHSKK